MNMVTIWDGFEVRQEDVINMKLEPSAGGKGWFCFFDIDNICAVITKKYETKEDGLKDIARIKAEIKQGG